MKPDKTFVKQQGQSDCGVACLLSIIQYYSGSGNLENLRRISGTNASGTTLLGLYQGAKEYGFDAEGCEADIESLIEHGEPCILHVVIENKLQHYIVCYGLSSGNSAKVPGKEIFTIGDPAKGIEEMPGEQLEKIWTSKACLTLKPNERFQKSTYIKSAKRKWIKELIREDISVLVIAAGIGVAMAILGMAMAIFSQRLIDEILPKKQYVKLNAGLAFVLLILLAKEALGRLRQYFLLQQSRAFNIRIIDSFYNRLLHLPKSFFDTRKIGELTARLSDTARIQRVISQLATSVIIDILGLLVSSIFIFFYSWQVGTACVLVLPLFYFLMYVHRKRIMSGQRDIMSAYAMTESNYISTLQGIDPIKNNNKQVLFGNTNKIIYQRYQDQVVMLGKIQIRLSFIANCFGTIFLIGILFFCGQQVLAGHLKIGGMMAILAMCGTLLPAVGSLAMISIPVNEAKIAFDRMFEFTGIEPESAKFLPEVLNFESLEVKHLTFRFAGRSRILNDISFHLNKGEIIAIMGENGCGKSTLTQILQKNYAAEEGSVLLNREKKLEDISLATLRNTIGTVPQNIHIFNGTVLDNIAFDDVATKPQKVFQFLESTGIGKFIDALPQSVMTIVGEEGINLSGGQKQIIALARALYHQPQLLILDEATAAMDREAEKFVLGLLMELRREMGIIFITHRLHVLKNFCDRIYILEDGRVSAKGNHEHLLTSQNLYSRYWSDLVQ